ncbi:hypothetical protein WH91_02335 [Devosia psychrophila]|uniref:Uncharacterized protein n=1 Tax=Devosia psychrophila TaxID=728005 RepID=A0ABR5E2X9_9HYPH|nr:hypothetical protein WH91_02335 [Devosia psychrophila]
MSCWIDLGLSFPVRLGSAEWLDDAFSVGDLLMIMVLRRLDGTCIIEESPMLSEPRREFRRLFGISYAAMAVCSSAA